MSKFATAVLVSFLLVGMLGTGYGLMMLNRPMPTHAQNSIHEEIRERQMALESVLSAREQISDHAILEELHGAKLPERFAAQESQSRLIIQLNLVACGILLGGHGLSWYNQKRMRRTLHDTRNEAHKLTLAVPETCQGECRLIQILPEIPADLTAQRHIRERIASLLANEDGASTGS